MTAVAALGVEAALNAHRAEPADVLIYFGAGKESLAAATLILPTIVFDANAEAAEGAQNGADFFSRTEQELTTILRQLAMRKLAARPVWSAKQRTILARVVNRSGNMNKSAGSPQTSQPIAPPGAYSARSVSVKVAPRPGPSLAAVSVPFICAASWRAM